MRLLAALLLAGAAHAAPLADMADAAAWTASASDQVKATLRRDRDGSLCLDADFNGVSGYAVMRRTLPVAWPEAFDLGVRWKGAGAVNDVQLKFVDASGDNVWWIHRPNAVMPKALADVRFKRRHVLFAWGPAADRTLRETQAVEFVIAAGRDGGRSSLCVAAFTLTPRAPDPAVWPEPRRRESPAALDLDLGAMREFNGLALRWPEGRVDYDVLASADGKRWQPLRRVRGSDGGLDALYLPEHEARHLRVQRLKPGPLPRVDLATWPDRNAMLAALAADAPRGHVPRAFVGQQNYWTLVGVDGGGERSGLISEDGAVEIGRGGFSIEPAVRLDDGRFVTWAEVATTHTLPRGHLPQPRVRWAHGAFTLVTEAAADGPAANPSLLARYTLTNTSATRRRFTLVLALRPWQVNPPQQFLTTPGGVRPVKAIAWQRGALVADGRPLVPDTAPARVSALPFDGGLSLAALLAGSARVVDPEAHASAALQFDVDLAPGESRRIAWATPLGAPVAAPPGDVDARFEAAAAAWRERLERVHIDAGPQAALLVATLRSTLAQMLMSRDGPWLRPGTRSYNRTWIRDGAMMVAGLVRLGEVDAARAFVDAFAPRVFANGKVPCCVDARGADPVIENDSHGQYLYAVAEVWRHTRDAAWLARHWPTVQRVVAWQEGLRQSTRTPGTPPHLFGLLPPSISHEGYSDKPAYSYWDDLWALRGYKDAVQIAAALGHDADARRWAGWRDEFDAELKRSVEATAALHRIGWVAGAADRGDFDATSTTMALNPAQAALPLLGATFEKYWQESLARAEGRKPWKDYTPYELRTVGALARLGHADRAHAMLDFFFRDQRPRGWNQWAEVVLPDAREPRFLGDMPHAWVASDFIRSALDLFAFDTDDALVLGAGWTAEWLAHGITVDGLGTAGGPLGYRVQRQGAGWALAVTRAPALPLRLAWALPGALPVATHEGRVLPWNAARRELSLPPGPVTVLLEPAR